jgi:hypothetical protein
MITKEWLKEQSACKEGYEWSVPRLKTPMNDKDFLQALIDDNKLDWANWVIIRLFNDTQNRRYAIYAAEQVIHIYEKEYPNDNRPRKAIEAAKAYLEDPTLANASAWEAARDAAWEAARAAAWDAARDAARAAAWDAAWDAARDAAYNDMIKKILTYGLTLLE